MSLYLCASIIEADLELLNMDRSIATYSSNTKKANIPFGLMVFKNIRLFLLGSDDLPRKAKMLAAQDLNSALERGWSGFEIAEQLPLPEIARTHEISEHPVRPGELLSARERRSVLRRLWKSSNHQDIIRKLSPFGRIHVQAPHLKSGRWRTPYPERFLQFCQPAVL
jgi:hypothetical protein